MSATPERIVIRNESGPSIYRPTRHPDGYIAVTPLIWGDHEWNREEADRLLAERGFDRTGPWRSNPIPEDGSYVVTAPARSRQGRIRRPDQGPRIGDYEVVDPLSRVLSCEGEWDELPDDPSCSVWLSSHRKTAEEAGRCAALLADEGAHVRKCSKLETFAAWDAANDAQEEAERHAALAQAQARFDEGEGTVVEFEGRQYALANPVLAVPDFGVMASRDDAIWWLHRHCAPSPELEALAAPVLEGERRLREFLAAQERR